MPNSPTQRQSKEVLSTPTDIKKLSTYQSNIPLNFSNERFFTVNATGIGIQNCAAISGSSLWHDNLKEENEDNKDNKKNYPFNGFITTLDFNGTNGVLDGFMMTFGEGHEGKYQAKESNEQIWSLVITSLKSCLNWNRLTETEKQYEELMQSRSIIFTIQNEVSKNPGKYSEIDKWNVFDAIDNQAFTTLTIGRAFANSKGGYRLLGFNLGNTMVLAWNPHQKALRTVAKAIQSDLENTGNYRAITFPLNNTFYPEEAYIIDAQLSADEVILFISESVYEGFDIKNTYQIVEAKFIQYNSDNSFYSKEVTKNISQQLTELNSDSMKVIGSTLSALGEENISAEDCVTEITKLSISKIKEKRKKQSEISTSSETKIGGDFSINAFKVPNKKMALVLSLLSTIENKDNVKNSDKQKYLLNEIWKNITVNELHFIFKKLSEERIKINTDVLNPKYSPLYSEESLKKLQETIYPFFYDKQQQTKWMWKVAIFALAIILTPFSLIFTLTFYNERIKAMGEIQKRTITQEELDFLKQKHKELKKENKYFLESDMLPNLFESQFLKNKLINKQGELRKLKLDNSENSLEIEDASNSSELLSSFSKTLTFMMTTEQAKRFDMIRQNMGKTFSEHEKKYIQKQIEMSKTESKAHVAKTL